MASIILFNRDSERAQVLVEALENAGYEIITTSDKDETVSKCIELNPDLVILDTDQSAQDAYNLNKDLRVSPQTRKIKVILIKSNNDPMDKSWTMTKGSEYYPFFFAINDSSKEDSLIDGISSLGSAH